MHLSQQHAFEVSKFWRSLRQSQVQPFGRLGANFDFQKPLSAETVAPGLLLHLCLAASGHEALEPQGLADLAELRGLAGLMIRYPCFDGFQGNLWIGAILLGTTEATLISDDSLVTKQAMVPHGFKVVQGFVRPPYGETYTSAFPELTS